MLRDGEVCAVAPEDVKVGETLCIEQGKTFPLDCIVTQGEGVVDNSPLFGAGEPQRVAPESTVLAGAVNLSGTIWAEATAEAEDSTAAKLMETLEDDLDKKGETERFLTKFSRIYTPIVLGLAILAMICLPLIFRVPVGESIHRGLVFLVIACPCALVISVPLAYFAGIGGAAKQGILFKSSTAMDKISKTKAVVFDKTGTLTTGQFRVTAVKSDKMDADMLLKIAAHAEAYSSHPIAKAIISAYGGVIYIELIESFREFAGRGITVTVNGIPITLGSQEFLESQGVSLSADGGVERAVYMAIQGIYAGRIILSDTIKADSAEAIRSLTEAGGERIAMVTGDSRQSSGDLAKAMGIGEYYAECLPGDKVARVQDMKSKMGGGSLIFVGDGKPTPEAADVGVDMGGLRHQTERADVIIMDDRPTKVATAIYAARSTRRIVFENIAVIFAFKLAVLILGALGISAMWFAVLADSGIAVAASLNSIRAFYIRRPK